MNYKGKLYGRVGKTYFPLEMTTDDIDELEAKLSGHIPDAGKMINACGVCEFVAEGDPDDYCKGCGPSHQLFQSKPAEPKTPEEVLAGTAHLNKVDMLQPTMIVLVSEAIEAMKLYHELNK